MALNAPRRLSDEQVREFIANGFVRLTPDVDDGLHREIEASLRFAVENEGWHGNNILPRIPQMHEVLNCDVVRGAVISLAGPAYCLHPHRAVHSSAPVEANVEAPLPEADAPRMGKGSVAGAAWHQDAQSPLARARHHVPRYLIGFYFPHETPIEMGPTRMQAGSHLFAHPASPANVVFEPVPAGAFFLLHFDMVHAGFPNRTSTTRYMVKFVFARTRHPAQPSWNNVSVEWRRPQQCRTDFDLPGAWSWIWSWMRGAPQPPGKRTSPPNAAAQALARHDGEDQPARLKALYSAATADNADSLVEALLASAGQGRHERTLVQDAGGQPLPRDDVRGYPRRWNERAVAVEDAAYALAACGAAAIPALQPLLRHADPWIQINAAFALGEVGPAAKSAVPLLVELLDSPCSEVVRQALDALGAIGDGLRVALPKIERLLEGEAHPSWHEPRVTRGWTAADQVRMNAAAALLSAVNNGEALECIERIATASLGDKNGYVSAIATEILTRIATPSALAAAVRFLAERRWDETLRGRIKPF